MQHFAKTSPVGATKWLHDCLERRLHCRISPFRDGALGAKDVIPPPLQVNTMQSLATGYDRLQSDPPDEFGDSVQMQAERMLRKSPYAQLRRIRCELINDTLFLRGQVTSFHIKQIAQETLRELGNVGRIYNFVEVISEFELRDGDDES